MRRDERTGYLRVEPPVVIVQLSAALHVVFSAFFEQRAIALVQCGSPILPLTLDSPQMVSTVAMFSFMAYSLRAVEPRMTA